MVKSDRSDTLDDLWSFFLVNILRPVNVILKQKWTVLSNIFSTVVWDVKLCDCKNWRSVKILYSIIDHAMKNGNHENNLNDFLL